MSDKGADRESWRERFGAVVGFVGIVLMVLGDALMGAYDENGGHHGE